jgi:type II secretory pathway pseudopilin PulG
MRNYKNPIKHGFSKCARRGFALIATLTLMILLAILAIGMLSLSAVSLRSSNQSDGLTQARANARMALMIAIGELQRYTGPDTRVTAPANLVDKNYPDVLGVWRSWEGTNHESNGIPKAPGYSSKNDPESNGGRFLKWLVSSAAISGSSGIDQAPSLVKNSAGAGTVPLLAGGSLQSTDTRQIHIVPTEADNGGRFAWWISGENQKARLSQPYAPRTDDVAGLAQMGQSHSVSNPGAFGLPTLIGDPEPNNADGATAKPGRKAISRKSMGLIEANNPTEPQKKFHDLTTQSVGLLTNTATGGWRKDLSILTERWDDIYASYPGGKLPLFRYTPTTAATSLVPKPTVTNYKPVQTNLYPWSDYSIILGNETPITLHAASASWASMVSFATTYKKFSFNSGVAESPFLWDVISRQGTVLTGQQMYNYKHTQRLYPLIARFQFLVYAKAIEDPARLGQSPKKYQLNLLFAPIITLLNPYNIRLTIDNPGCPTSGVVIGARRAYPGALAVVSKTTYPNPDTVPGNQYKLLSPGNFQYLDVTGNFSNQYDTNLKENIDRFNPEQTKANSWINGASGTFGANLPFGKIIFEPGEAIMFSPDGNIPTGFGGATAYGMEKGYRPAEAKGREVNVASNLTADRSYWFLLRNDKFTQPFKNRAPGVGFSLSYGIETGPAYLNLPLYTGIGNEYHNITSITNGDIAQNYWPQSDVDEIGYSIAELASGPWIPLFSMNQGPRMTIGTPPGTAQNRPTKGVLQSNPFASIVLTDPAWKNMMSHPANGAFDMTYHSLSFGSNLTPNLSDSEGFIATGYQSGDGLSRLIMADIPLRPMASLVELQGWNPRGNNPYPPFQANLIGNSDATPLIPQDDVVPPALEPSKDSKGTEYSAAEKKKFNLIHDDAYCANHLLFDDWFLSSIAPDPAEFGSANTKDINTVYREFLKGERELVNRAYRPIPADSSVTDDQATARIAEIINKHDGWLKIASRFEVEGMFNVNSTSVEAWKAVLGHAKSLEQIAMYGEDDMVVHDISDGHVVTRGAIATDVEAGSGAGYGGKFASASEYTGYRSLSDEQIEDLAEKVVEQVRVRGPFLSLSEFVNRQLSNNEDLALAGAVQTALNKLSEDPMAKLRNPANSLSDNTMSPNDDKLSGVGYEFTEAAAGSSAYGAPGWIRQADILRPIAPVLTVRDDTFTIRSYGDARDKNGNVVAQAWCEAVVKRTRDFTQTSDAADSVNPPVGAYNTTFGRRYEIVSFRWLSADEV